MIISFNLIWYQSSNLKNSKPLTDIITLPIIYNCHSKPFPPDINVLKYEIK